MKNKFGVIEVGSTNTKGYICTKEDIEEFPFRNIEFKKNYKANEEITKEDKEKLFIYIKNKRTCR